MTCINHQIKDKKIASKAGYLNDINKLTHFRKYNA